MLFTDKIILCKSSKTNVKNKLEEQRKIIGKRDKMVSRQRIDYMNLEIKRYVKGLQTAG